MSFFGRKQEEPKPSIEAIHLNLAKWKPYQQVPNQWIKPGPDMLQLLFFDNPTDLPCDMANERCWLIYFTEMVSKSNGAVVSVKAQQIQGLQAVQTIFKFHQPKIGGLSDLGITYLGTWMVPFADFSFNIQVQSFEGGQTGVREAAVMLHLEKDDPSPKVPASNSVPAFKSMDEYFNLVRTRTMIRLRADDEAFDKTFPDHPLSRLRAELSHIADTLQVDDVIRQARPFKVS